MYSWHWRDFSVFRLVDVPMKPISLTVNIPLASTPELLFENILELENWTSFEGYGPLPGIESARYESCTEEIVGRRIRVLNRDGSSHVEEILTWDCPYGLTMELKEFSRPLSYLATHFIESWTVRTGDSGTHIVRSFQLFPKNLLTRPPVWLIGRFMRRAIARHTAELAGAVRGH